MRSNIPAWGLLASLAAAFSAPAYSKNLENVEYSRPEGTSLQFDAWIPDTPGPHPAVIVVHGGAWVSGNRRGSVRPLFAPLEQAGIAWFSISYRLANVINADT